MIRKFALTLVALGTAVGLGSSMVPVVATAHDSDVSKVMGSIDVASGEHTGDVSTVNGSVRIGTDAVVGNAKTVNGGVHLESRAKATELTTVNGGIHVDDGGQVDGDVHTVNGGVHIEDNAEVSGDLRTVNGGIHVGKSHIHGSIKTTNGGIRLGPSARIDGDVLVEANHGSNMFGSIPHIVIGPGTVVKGKLHFGREVMLYVSDSASIGPVEGAEVHKFSGENPPSE